jgi:betaine-aldehyde dehydrogenase
LARPAAPPSSASHGGQDCFTRSTEVGKSIVRRSADPLKRVTLEPGGKSPNILFADADWEGVDRRRALRHFINQGEVCSAGSRILVEKKDLFQIRRSDE